MLGFGSLGQFSLGEFGGATPAAATPEGWRTQFDVPDRRNKRGYAVALIASGVFFTPVQQEQVSVASWMQPLSTPLKAKRGLPVYEQQAVAFVHAPQVSVASWMQPFSVPQRLLRSQQGFTAAPLLVTTPEVITVDKWYQQFSDPTRRRIQRLEGFAAAPVLVTTPEVITLDKWYRQFSDPTRRLARPQEGFAAAPVLVTTPEVVTLDKWYQQLSNPSRKPRLLTAQQGFNFLNAPVVQLPPVFSALSEPRRSKRGLHPSQQKFASLDVFPQPATVQLQWFRPLDEPVRQRIGFKAWLKQSVAWPPQTLGAGITGVMAATETNSDQAEIVYIVSRAVASAKVSIVEGPQAAAATSLRES